MFDGLQRSHRRVMGTIFGVFISVRGELAVRRSVYAMLNGGII